MKLTTARQIARQEQQERSAKNKAKLLAQLDDIAEQWVKDIDLLETLTARKESMREKIIKLVEENGDGEEFLASSRFVFRAKRIVGSPKVDGGKLALKLSKPQYDKYRNMVIKKTTSYSVDEKKLIQLVQRGIIPPQVLTACTTPGGERGYRVEISKVKSGKKSNAITP